MDSMRSQPVVRSLCPSASGKDKCCAIAVRIGLATSVFALCAALFAQDTPTTFGEIVKQATTARDGHNSGTAITLYKQAVELQPTWPDGWWYLGMLQYGAGDFAASRDALTRYIALKPNAAPALAVRGLCEFETGERQKSLDDIRTALAQGASDHSANESILRYHLALLFTLRGDFEDALREFALLAHEGGADPELLTSIGVAGLRISVLPADLKPDVREVAEATGAAAYYSFAADEQKSERAFKVLFQRYPTMPNLHYLRGYLLFAKDPERAVTEFRRELEVAHDSPWTDVMLAWCLLLQNDATDALPYAEKAAAEDPTSSVSEFVLGRALVDTGNLTQALPQLQNAAKAHPDDLEIHLALVKAYSESGRKDDARRERLLCLNLTEGQPSLARP